MENNAKNKPTPVHSMTVPQLVRRAEELHKMKEYEASLNLYMRILSIDPEHHTVRARILEEYEKRRRFDKAETLFREGSQQSRQDPLVLATYAAVCFRRDDIDKAIAYLKEALTKPSCQGEVKRLCYFRIGYYYDKKGEYDEAFSYFKKSCELNQPECDLPSLRQFIADTIETFSAQNMKVMPRSSVEGSECLVFVLGMPRSGTTLLEAILGMHAQIEICGELRYLFNFVDRLPALCHTDKPFPACMPWLRQELVDDASLKYLRRMRKLYPHATAIIDKLPHNFYYVGLIKLLFPEARIIHMRRHPLDTCLSCYFQSFARGHAYSYDLSHMAHHYRDYLRMMQHWRDVGISMLEIDYEFLVADMESQVKKVLAYLGLEWDKSCSKFYEIDRVSRTASYEQVQQPLYTRSAGRWKNYESHIQPLLDVLGPVDKEYKPGVVWRAPDVE